MKLLIAIAFMHIFTAVCLAESDSDQSGNEESTRPDQLAEQGIELSLGMTSVYQQNMRGGLSTNSGRGRFAGSYDLELAADLNRFLGMDGAGLYVHAEGGFPRSDEDAASIGSFFGANADATGRRAMDVVEVYYEQAFFEETLRIRVGKLDITGGFECGGCAVSFDGSAFANDETTQFLNGALVNNPTIPFPDYGLGAVVYWNPLEWWYASFAVVDAQADGRETGFRTAFHGEDYFLYIFETGVTPEIESENGPLKGAYRVGVWADPQPKAHSDTTRVYRDDVGYYVSADQLVYKENDVSEDTQGLGVFARYGLANDHRNDLVNFYSFGMQYQGLFDGRDDDVLAIGYAQGFFSDRASMTFGEDYESVLEIYYKLQISPRLEISPGIQYIANPGGASGVSDATVFAVRAQWFF